VMTPWTSFFTVTGEAAATLAGLMFVAVTFGSKIVTPEVEGPARGTFSPIIHHFMHAFAISCAALVPGDHTWLIGSATIGVAVVRILTLPIVYRQLRKAEELRFHIERSDWILQITLPLAVYLFFCVSGVGYVIGSAWAVYGIALSVFGILVLGFFAAWHLLFWMAARL
jgi:hypothetical protein